MQLVHYISFILVLTLLSCGGNPDEHKKTPSAKKEVKKQKGPNAVALYDAYLKRIPKLRLPLNLECEKEPKASHLKMKACDLSKYGIGMSRIVGKLFENEDFVAVLYLYPGEVDLPILKTTDRKGKLISKLRLYEKFCGEDEFSWGTSWVNISSARKITLTDSTITYERFEQGGIIEQTRTTEVRRRVYKIDSKGKIRKKSEKTETV